MVAKAKKKGQVGWFNREGKLFYGLMIALPILQFVIFYIVVNFNSILLAFQSYSNFGGKEVRSWVGFANFAEIWDVLVNDPGHTIQVCIRNTMLFFLVDILMIMPLSLLFGYYIHKKALFAGFFKVVLFLPSIVCSMVFVIFFNYFVDDELVRILQILTKDDLLVTILGGDAPKALLTLIVFYVWFGFSCSILLYLNAMSNVSPAVIEAAKVDGASEFRIFWNIMIPGCWKTLVSLFIISLAATASSQAYLFSFYAGNAPAQMQTLGYYQFMLIIRTGQENPVSYPIASAYGVILTLIVAPLTFGARYLLNRFGPRED